MPRDSARGLLDQGLRYLGEYLFEFSESALPSAIGRFEAAAESEPGRAPHWIALGFALDAADRPRDALGAFERAARLDPDDQDVAVFIVTLLAELGPEGEALAAVEATAGRLGVDLNKLRGDLTAADMPTDSRTLIQNGFVRARNFIRSRLSDEIDRVEREAEPEETLRREEEVRRECMEERERLETSLDPGAFPHAIRDAIPWARRLGVGDPACREMLLGQLSRAQRSELAGIIERVAPDAHAWLDSFGDMTLSAEAAATMFLLLALEESQGW